MSLPPTVHRKTSDADHPDTNRSDKDKRMSPHTKTKNGASKKSETHGHTSVLKKSKTLDHSTVHNKTDTKKRPSVDTHGKATHTAVDTHTNEVTKSHGATVVHATHPPNKAQTHTDTHGKVLTRGRSESHSKTSAHGTSKKSDLSKPRTNKNNKAEHDKNNRENEDHTETNNVITTAVSQNSEDHSDKKTEDGD